MPVIPSCGTQQWDLGQGQVQLPSFWGRSEGSSLGGCWERLIFPHPGLVWAFRESEVDGFAGNLPLSLVLLVMELRSL